MSKSERSSSRTLKKKKRESKLSHLTTRQFEAETKAINRMRGMLEDEASEKRRQMMQSIKDENKRLALEKRMREERDKDWQGSMDQREISRDD